MFSRKRITYPTLIVVTGHVGAGKSRLLKNLRAESKIKYPNLKIGAIDIRDYWTSKEYEVGNPFKWFREKVHDGFYEYDIIFVELIGQEEFFQPLIQAMRRSYFKLLEVEIKQESLERAEEMVKKRAANLGYTNPHLQSLFVDKEISDLHSTFHTIKNEKAKHYSSDYPDICSILLKEIGDEIYHGKKNY